MIAVHKALLGFVILSVLGTVGASASELDPESPSAFFPEGILGLQIGSPWERVKKNPALGHLRCEPIEGNRSIVDEVCFFQTVSALLVAGAEIHDGFIVRQGRRVVLIGTGIGIVDPDDPRAEAVMRVFQSQVHAGFQHTGAEVLFVNMPQRRLSAAEMAGYARTAPVLLVELEPEGKELAIFYGYLAPVNAFSALTAD